MKEQYWNVLHRAISVVHNGISYAGVLFCSALFFCFILAKTILVVKCDVFGMVQKHLKSIGKAVLWLKNVSRLLSTLEFPKITSNCSTDLCNTRQVLVVCGQTD